MVHTFIQYKQYKRSYVSSILNEWQWNSNINCYYNTVNVHKIHHGSFLFHVLYMYAFAWSWQNNACNFQLASKYCTVEAICNFCMLLHKSVLCGSFVGYDMLVFHLSPASTSYGMHLHSRIAVFWGRYFPAWQTRLSLMKTHEATCSHGDIHWHCHHRSSKRFSLDSSSAFGNREKLRCDKCEILEWLLWLDSNPPCQCGACRKSRTALGILLINAFTTSMKPMSSIRSAYQKHQSRVLPELLCTERRVKSWSWSKHQFCQWHQIRSWIQKIAEQKCLRFHYSLVLKLFSFCCKESHRKVHKLRPWLISIQRCILLRILRGICLRWLLQPNPPYSWTNSVTLSGW